MQGLSIGYLADCLERHRSRGVASLVRLCSKEYICNISGATNRCDSGRSFSGFLTFLLRQLLGLLGTAVGFSRSLYLHKKTAVGFSRSLYLHKKTAVGFSRSLYLHKKTRTAYCYVHLPPPPGFEPTIASFHKVSDHR